MKNISIVSKILCEDIRQEKSNKHILIGVYGGNIVVPKTPANISLAVYIEAKMLKIKPSSVWLKFSGPGKGSGKIKLDYIPGGGDENLIIPTPKVGVLLEKEGAFSIEISDDDDTWEPLIEKTVIVNDGISTLNPTASQLPSEQSPPDAPAS
jgi:hypothetical protein